MRSIFFVASLTLLVFLSSFTFAQDYDLAGASKPRPQLSLKGTGDNQYKRVHQYALRLLINGEADGSEKFLEKHLAKHPEDEETHFLLGVVTAQQGDAAAAANWLKKAVDLGLPPGRIVAGPRELLAEAIQQPALREIVEAQKSRPVHGPLIGSTTDTSVSIWLRTAQEADVQVQVRGGRQVVKSDPVRSKQEDDFSVVVTLSGLQPATEYTYSIQIGDGAPIESDVQRFKTFPATGKPGKFSIAFGGGAGYVPPHERMWDTIRERHPDALLLLGDNVYIDDPESPHLQRYTYYRRQSRPEWHKLTAQTPTYTIWDDHDFSTNDSWGGPKIDAPFWKRDYSWDIFRENWANPGYGDGFEQPGCWYQFKIADVDFVMLDCRYYRTSPRDKNPTMLGPVQMEWLKEALKNCDGTFKVICSSVPWDFRTKGDSLDTWNGFKKEREEIFRFLEDNKIEGVALMSADRHRSDAWHIERPNGYGFYEFNSSRLTNQHVHPTMVKQGAIFSYNKKQSFGLVTFDTAADKPAVTYDVYSIDGEKIDSLTVDRSKLSY